VVEDIAIFPVVSFKFPVVKALRHSLAPLINLIPLGRRVGSSLKSVALSKLRLVESVGTGAKAASTSK